MKIDRFLLDKMDAEHSQLVQPREHDREMRRLARLGLWAEEHAIPALDLYDDRYSLLWAKRALDALPKKEPKP